MMKSTQKLAQAIIDILNPSSVVDFGCGRGYWLQQFLSLGITNVRGFEVQDFPNDQWVVDKSLVVQCDLTKEILPERRYDLAICIEVAEHLPISAADQLISNIVAHSDFVMFGAAIPYQEGAGHINENWIEFWLQIFASKKYVCFDIFRWKHWNDREIHWWYRQNTVLFVKESRLPFMAKLGYHHSKIVYSVVHPEMYLLSINRSRAKGNWRLEKDIDQYYALINNRIKNRFPSLEQNYTYGGERVWHETYEPNKTKW